MYRFNRFLFYTSIGCALLLFQCVQSDVLDETITKCLNRKLETNLELPLEIINDNGVLELWFSYNEKYDLYQTYNNGHIYHYELQISEKLSPRTGVDRANCSNYLPVEPNWYSCPYTVTEDEHQVNITLESFLRKVTYSIDKSSKKVVHLESESGLYGPTQEKKQLDCVNDVAKYGKLLPVEVRRKENHLEVAVRYQGKYDFYNTISLGTICGIQYQLDEIPSPTVEEYAHCSKCGNAAELYAWCPFKISEDENVVTITLEAFFYKNVYTVNKSTNEVQYEKSLIGKDPKKQFEKDINACKDTALAVKFSIPVQIKRNDNFLEIWVKRDDKYDIFETFVSGSVCKHDLQSSRDPNVLVPRPPADCFSPGLDIPYYFICPYDVLEDDEFVYFKVHANDQYLYAFNKSTGELVFRNFPTIYDSGHQGTLTYLRSVVMDPNFI